MCVCEERNSRLAEIRFEAQSFTRRFSTHWALKVDCRERMPVASCSRIDGGAGKVVERPQVRLSNEVK